MPVISTAIAAGTAAAGTAATAATLVTAGTAIVSGIASFQASNYQAAVAKANQFIVDSNAIRSIEESQLEQQEQDDLTAALLGSQTAKQGASGLAVGSTSFQQARSTGRRLGRLDALRIRDKGVVEAINFQNQSAFLGAEAKQTKIGGKLALLGSFLEAGSLLGGSKSTSSSLLRGFSA